MATQSMYLLHVVATLLLAVTQVTGFNVPLNGKLTDLPAAEKNRVTAQPEVDTKHVTAVFCEYRCTIGGHLLCYPPPCPPPGCVDPDKYLPTDCCEYCPNGPNCSGPEGKIIKLNHWEIIEGKNCTCQFQGQDATCV